MRNSKILLFFVVFGFTSNIFADAPIEDYSVGISQNDSAPQTVIQMQSTPEATSEPSSTEYFSNPSAVDSSTEGYPSAPSSTSNLTIEERVNLLERRIDNINQSNTQGRLDDLQQQMQKLNGDLDVQTHNLQKLQEQMRSLYGDLEQRIIDGGANGSAKKNSSVAASNSLGLSSVEKTPKPAKTAGKTAQTSGSLAQDIIVVKDQQSYQSAVDFLQARKYDDAAKKLNSYLTEYPNGAYVANAHYWLGEISFMQKRYSAAASEFGTVIKKYSSSAKVPEAMLKLALIHDSQGNHDLAKKELLQLKKRYPKSSAAKLAEQQLAIMN